MKAVRTSLLTALLLGGLVSSAQAAEITVSAAASLTNAFKDIAQDYEKQYPDAKINLNFAASGALLSQMAKGAPVDVFASADQQTMDKAEQQGLVRSHARETFATNSLVVIVPTDSKLSLNSLQDLTGESVQKLAIGNPASVPVGNYTKQTMEKAGLWQDVQPKLINTQNVRQSLDYVSRGEVDAGFVYATDASTMKDKVKVSFEVPTETPVTYPIAYTVQTDKTAEARRFINYVLSPKGQSVLGRYGFKQP